MYNYRNRKGKERSGDLVARRKNPAFMDQNINALAHQLNSRDSMMPKATRLKFKDSSMDGFEDVDLREEVETFSHGKQGIKLNGIDQEFQLSDLSCSSSTEDNSKFLLKKYDTSFKQSSSSEDNSKSLPRKSSFKPSKVLMSVSKSEESIPPLPEKRRNEPETNPSNNRISHYDSLPMRESLPIKQRKNSARDVMDIIAPVKGNPEYDVLPLKTFCGTTSDVEKQGESTLTMTSSNNDFPSSVSDLKATSVDLSNSMDNVFQETVCPENKSRHSHDTDSSFDECDIETAHHDTIEKMRKREPANRAPSFVALPRAASGSLRTAL